LAQYRELGPPFDTTSETEATDPMTGFAGAKPIGVRCKGGAMGAGEDLTNFSDLVLGQGAADQVAIIDGPRRHNYSALRGAVAALVAELHRLHLEPGSRIGILGPNSFFWVAAYLAAVKVGVAVPFSDKCTPAELSAQAEWVGCSALLTDRRTLRRYGAAFVGPVVTEEAVSRSAEAHLDATPVDPSADAALMFTSGTTSRPKAVRVTHANLRANTASIVSYLQLTQSDRALAILPFHYCFGASLLHTHLAVGGSLVLCNTFAFPETAVELIDRETCTVFAGVPSSFQLLLRTSTYASRPLPTLRLVQQAGGRLAPDRIRELADAQPSSALFVMYGQTEATARLSYLPPAMLEHKVGSIGRGIPGVNLEVVDEAGLPVGPGENGEIVASGGNISPGYYRDPESTALKFPGGVLRTGDLATVDADGYIYIVGRSAEFIKSWGHRISPQQVEEAALAHPDVADAAVVGLPDPEAGESINLVMVPSGSDADFNESDLLIHLRERLPKHMLPKEVHLLDSLPLNASGKVARPQLRAMLQAKQAR
jgi:long-chain acyl-CoA synthetase